MIEPAPSLAGVLASMNGHQFEAYVARLASLAETDPDALEKLLYDWSFWGRPDQQEPETCQNADCKCDGTWNSWMVCSGRGWGKTHTGAATVDKWASMYPGCRIALIGRSAGDVRNVMLEGESGLLSAKIAPAGTYDYEPSKTRVTHLRTNSIISLYSADEPNNLRGPQHHFFWADELAAWERGEEMWANLQFGLRLTARVGWPNAAKFRPRGLITTTPRPTAIVRKIAKDPRVHLTVGSTYDNRANLSDHFFQQIITEYESTRLGQQELLGLLLEDVPGALWKASMIDKARVTLEQVPDNLTTVISLDPASTANVGSNLTGIVVCAVGPAPGDFDSQDFLPVDEIAATKDTLANKIKRMGKLHGYVLRDASLKGSPDQWARKAVALYYDYDAVAIVAEANQGGDMVKHTIHSVDPSVPVWMVNASKGKKTRAEPIVALYEQGKVHHVGLLDELEKELTGWDPEVGASPDRLDAMVWGVWRLMVRNRPRPTGHPVIVGVNKALWEEAA